MPSTLSLYGIRKLKLKKAFPEVISGIYARDRDKRLVYLSPKPILDFVI